LQGLAGGVFEGVGVSIGSFVGGILFAKIGGSKTFLWFSIMSFVAFACHVFIQWLIQRFSNSPGKNKVNGNSETMLKNYASADNKGSGGEQQENIDKIPYGFKEIDLKK
jgi:hypothetical protein